MKEYRIEFINWDGDEEEAYFDAPNVETALELFHEDFGEVNLIENIVGATIGPSVNKRRSK